MLSMKCSDATSVFSSDMGDEPVRNEDRFLMLGLSKGTIVFIDVKHFTEVYARFSIITSAIKMVREVIATRTFVLFSEEFNLTLFGFKNSKSVVLQTVSLFRPVMEMCVSGKSIILGFSSGDTEFFWIDSDQSTENEHEKTYISKM